MAIRTAFVIVTAMGLAMLAGCDSSSTSPIGPHSSGTSLVGPNWVVSAYDVSGTLRRSIAGSTVTITFATDRTVSGSGGCNTYSGKYSLTGDRLKLGRLAMTAMACLKPGVMEQEAAFVAALGRSTRVASSSGHLSLTDDSGTTQVALKAT
jgi:heat shock protein HslJ